MGLLVFLAVSRALSRSFTQQTCIAMDPLLSKDDYWLRLPVSTKNNHLRIKGKMPLGPGFLVQPDSAPFHN
jgi:hypothetical protein